MNAFRQGENDLAVADYSDLLDKILKILQHQQTKNPFGISSDRRRLLVDIDTVATQVALEQVQNPLADSKCDTRAATLHFSQEFKTLFPGKIREIDRCLRQLLESELGPDTCIEEFATSLITELQAFSGTVKSLGLTYDFGKKYQDLQKHKLSLDSNGSTSILQFHKLTIAVQNTDKFEAKLKQGLEDHFNSNKFDFNQSEQEKLREMLQEQVTDKRSDFHRLKRVIDTESLGKLKKEAKIIYLEYLLGNIHTVPGVPDSAAVIYLKDLIRRLRLIEEYISGGENNSHYQVNYGGRSANYKDLFSRSDALDALPIIPIIAGSLGETTERNGEERTFIFGLKLKLGGSVQLYGGCSAFDYHLNLLNPDTHADEIAKNPFFGEKVLKLAFLYYFVFACRSNPLASDYQPYSELSYDPRSIFEARVLPILQGSDEEAKKDIFRAIKQGLEQYNVSFKINKLIELLKNFLERQTHLPMLTYSRFLRVKSSILEPDINNIVTGKFFKEVLSRNPKQSLRYICVTSPSVNSKAVCQLPVSISIEDIHYFPTEESQKFSMEYDIKGIKTLPLLWVPRDERSMNVYKRYFLNNKLVLLLYDNQRLNSNGLNSTQAFVYRFTFCLLAYTCLQILLDGQNKLFIPMLRLHQGDGNKPSLSEEFMAALSRVLSHLLKEKHCSSSQGFRIQKELDAFRVRNGLSSLYSVLPKKFSCTFNTSSLKLEKLAIIIISSRESDAGRSHKSCLTSIANLMGEIVSVRRLEDGIQIETLKTFSENYSVRHLSTQPSVLKETVDNLYQQGYRHFLYIAQSPCSSTLHITKSEQDEGLFFMSPNLISFLKSDYADIKIYPVFFEKYYVRKQKALHQTSFNIQDTKELASLVKDSSRKTVVFFNLFNGMTVGQGEERFYNGVISYSIRLNRYQGILDDTDIYEGLIDDTPLKNDLLQYITLFHFSRYEARQKISLKLDPYKNIIGEESIEILSAFNHMSGSTEFNSLAFLTEVGKALSKYF